MKALDIHSQIQRKLLVKKRKKENNQKICLRVFLIVLDAVAEQSYEDVAPVAAVGKNESCWTEHLQTLDTEKLCSEI